MDEAEELPISELFGRDPLELTKPDLDRIVEKYRGARELFAAGVKPVREKKAKASTAGLALDLIGAAEEPEINMDLLG